MKAFGFIFFMCWAIMFMIFWTNQPNEQPQPLQEPYTSPAPEPGRPVEEFDWDHNRFIYKDQVKPNKKKYKIHKPYPDAFVSGMQQESFSTRTEDRILVEGKRYRVWHKLNGETQLVPLR